MPLILPVAAAAANTAITVAAPAAGRIASGLIGNLITATRSGAKISSLADISRPARVEPLALVDKALTIGERTTAMPEYMEPLMKFGLTTFIGYYLQAISLITNVGRIDTLKVFDSLNPYRSQGSVTDALWSNEAYANGLPSVESFGQPTNPYLIASLENEEEATANGVAVGKDIPKQLFEENNLAVGKMITVELKDGNQMAKIPVLVRLIPAVIPSQAMTHIFTAGGSDNWTDRYYMARAGQIRWIKDLILGMDLVEEHRKALTNDPTGMLSQIVQRRRNNLKKTLVTGQASMADASNIAVISKETAVEMGRAMYGKLSSKATRDKIFDNSYLLVLMIVDVRASRVVVYHRGLDIGSDYSFNEIKGSEKNKGPDINEIFKSMHQVLGG